MGKLFPPECDVHEVTILDTDEIDSVDRLWQVGLPRQGNYYARTFIVHLTLGNGDADAAPKSWPIALWRVWD